MDSIQQRQGIGRITSRKEADALPYKHVSSLDQPKYKSWLIMKGFKQEHGINYDEIFSHVVKMMTLWLLLGVVVME